MYVCVTEYEWVYKLVYVCMAELVERLSMVRETWVQSKVASYERL